MRRHPYGHLCELWPNLWPSCFPQLMAMPCESSRAHPVTRTDGEVRRVRSDHGVESVIDVSEVLIDAGAECKRRAPKPTLDCGRLWRFRLTDRGASSWAGARQASRSRG